MPDILGCRVDKVNMLEAVSRIESLAAEGRFVHIVTLNAEIAYMAETDDKLRNIINAAELVTPDGSGIVWAAGRLGEPLEERVAGIDLLNEVCALAAERGYGVYLLGSEPGVAEAAAAALQMRLPELRVCGTHHGFFLKEQGGTERVIGQLRAISPDIIFVAMGAPKQELVIDELRRSLEHGVVMGVGGSFDVLAGRVKRAPKAVQKLRLEWLWRTVLQPSRWKRTMRLPLFMRSVNRQSKAVRK